MSSAYEKSAVQNEKISDSHKNLPIEDNKVADTGETENIDRKTVPEKLPIENYAKAYSNKAYNEPTINNMTKRQNDKIAVLYDSPWILY